MKNKLIHDPATGLYLDGFDGTSYEWTADRKRAWRFAEGKGYGSAQSKLELVRKLHPQAQIVDLRGGV